METAVRLVNAHMVEGVLLLIVIVAIKVPAILFKTHMNPILHSLALIISLNIMMEKIVMQNKFNGSRILLRLS